MFSLRLALSAIVLLRTQQLLVQEALLPVRLPQPASLPPLPGAPAHLSRPLQLTLEAVELLPPLLQLQAHYAQEALQTVVPLPAQLFLLAPKLALRAQLRRFHVTFMTMLANASPQLRAP